MQRYRARRHYRNCDKADFFVALRRYALALESGDSFAIVTESIKIHVALGSVPKSYKRYVTRAFSEHKAKGD